MRREHLIRLAKTVVEDLKKKKGYRKSINTYASFADQVIALINDGRVSSKGDLRRFTGMVYPRPRMKGQWWSFGEVLGKNLRQLDKESLLYFFGYLKRLLTIEGKRETEERKKLPGGQPGYGKRRGKFRS